MMAGLSNSAHTVHSKHNHSLDMKCYAAACLSQKQAHVATGASMPLQQRSIVGKSRPAVVEVVSFKFMKKLGVKKPGFLPDFGKVCSAAPAIKRARASDCCFECLNTCLPCLLQYDCERQLCEHAGQTPSCN